MNLDRDPVIMNAIIIPIANKNNIRSTFITQNLIIINLELYYR